MFDAEGKIRIAWISTAVVNIALAIAVMAMLTQHEVSEVQKYLLIAFKHMILVTCIFQQFHVCFSTNCLNSLLVSGPPFINCMLTLIFTILFIYGATAQNLKAVFTWMSLSIIQGIMETLFIGLVGIDFFSSSGDPWTFWISVAFIANLATRVCSLVIATSLQTRIKSSYKLEKTEVTEL